jgi:hypothetical protein
MRQVRKNNMQDYWSTNLIQTTSRTIKQAWHLSNNSQHTQHSGRLSKIHCLCEYVLHKFRSLYSPHREPSLHESMIP